MKLKGYVTLVFSLITFLATAQNEYEALKFSQFLPSGTARYTAMGGAFSALGGDMSTMATNPAGTGLYRKSEIGISTAWTNHNTASNYNGINRDADQFSFQLANVGFVSTYPNGTNSNWKSFNFGFAYNHMNDYNNSVSIKGFNTSSSMLDLQTDILNGNPNQADINAYYLADAVYYDDDDNLVNDYMDSNYGSEQVHQISTSGYAGEYDVNFSGNYNDILYVGATMGFQRIHYEQNTFHGETPSNEISLIGFESKDYLKAKGSGFNFKFGMLYKVTQELRIGAAIHTPTFYNFRYDYWTDVNATIEYSDGIYDNVGKSPRGNYNWEFASPTRLILSSAYVLGSFAIVSGEIEYANYSSMNISASDYFFEQENQNIKDIYEGSINARLGAEFKLGILSLRAGAGFFESPYKSTEANADANTFLLSGGFGISSGLAYFDAAYQYVTSEEYYYMYGYESSQVKLNNTSHKFMATVGFRF